MRLISSLAFLSLIVGVVGCDSKQVASKLTLVEVKGTVTLPDGSPLKSGSIHFEPESKEKARTEVSVVKDGSFTVKMAPSKYKVAFDVDNKNMSYTPVKYRDFKTTDENVEVTSSSTTIDIKLK